MSPMSQVLIKKEVEQKPEKKIAATTPKQWSIERLVLVFTGLLVVFANFPFWQATLANRNLAAFGTWQYVFSTALFIWWLHAVPILLLGTRFTVRPILTLFVLIALVAQHMMWQYGVILDPSMMRNTLRTDVREASELMTPWLFANIGLAGLATFVIWRIPLRRKPWRTALWTRALTLLGISVVALGAFLFSLQDFSSTMRNQKELRYRITPGNVIYSTGRVLTTDLKNVTRTMEPLLPITVASPAANQKPRLLVLIVGETARAMNFSLNGYARPTNPELSKLPIINFPHTTACGSSTEVSLPCMFSSQGRTNYDESLIRSSESLIQLLSRAGMHVVWLDNQSGCKGVCTGVEFKDMTSSDTDPILCPDGRCFDGVLVQGLSDVIHRTDKAPAQDTVVVLHQLGNHGPAYSKRYPPEFNHFTPNCTKSELRDCSQKEIVNAYDNAILYTDHLIASTIHLLQQQASRFDVGLIYVSDHGESLGEKGLYLHGMPYAIAPKEQLAVPMIWWLGDTGVRGWNGINETCLRERANLPAQHDHLFHSVLGLFRIGTARYVPDRDLVSTCRPKASAQ